MKNRIYLDTNIFVNVYSDEESNKTHKQEIEAAFKVFLKLKDLELTTSVWSITEMVKALIINVKMDPIKVAEIEQDLTNEGRLHGIKVKTLEVCPNTDYDFKEFFYHIRKGILSNSSGIGDNIHSIIMKNNNIEKILTYNEKDFRNIAGITTINPKDVKL